MNKLTGLTGYLMGLIVLQGTTMWDAHAATLSEMRMINASLKPGSVVTCNWTSEIPQKGDSPVRIESVLTGVVLQKDGDRQAFDVTLTQHYHEQLSPFNTTKYQVTTELEATRYKMVVDPETIDISLPYARRLEADFLTMMKATPVSYDDYSTYRILSATDYQIAYPDAPVRHCTVRGASG